MLGCTVWSSSHYNSSWLHKYVIFSEADQLSDITLNFILLICTTSLTRALGCEAWVQSATRSGCKLLELERWMMAAASPEWKVTVLTRQMVETHEQNNSGMHHRPPSAGIIYLIINAFPLVASKTEARGYRTARSSGKAMKQTQWQI